MTKDRNGRTNTAVRLDPDNYERLTKASEAFGLSMNYLINYAVRDFLDRMIEPSELRLTRAHNAPASQPENPSHTGREVRP